MPYIVRVPKDPRLEKSFDRHLKKVAENGEYAIYQGTVEAIIPLNVGWPEATALYGKIKVDGGYKRLPLTWYRDGQDVPAEEPVLVLAPKRDKMLTVRLSEEEYRLLKEDAYSAGRSVSGWARELVMNLVWEYLEREKFREAMRKVMEKEGSGAQGNL